MVTGCAAARGLCRLYNCQLTCSVRVCTDIHVCKLACGKGPSEKGWLVQWLRHSIGHMMASIPPHDGDIARLVERRTHYRKVTGSILRKHGALRPQKPLRLIRDGEAGGSGILFVTPTRYTVTARMTLHQRGQLWEPFQCSIIVWAKSQESVNKQILGRSGGCL